LLLEGNVAYLLKGCGFKAILPVKKLQILVLAFQKLLVGSLGVG
jgi:hypothetical protein